MTDISRGLDANGLRWYEVDGVRALSVTTVLSVALEEDTTGLDIWRDRNDGSGDSPYWQHLFWFSAPRGTICHYEALKQFEHIGDSQGESPSSSDSTDSDDAHDEPLYGEEESRSWLQLINGPSEGAYDEYDVAGEAPCEEQSVVYSVLKKRGVVNSREAFEENVDTSLTDIVREDTDWFVDQFEDICDELHVTDSSVIYVEQFLLNDEIGYGGQCDLVYEDPSGDVVVADLKTSSGLRQKHRLQSVAYMKAIEQADDGPDSVDRVEVWRIDPDDRTYQVHANEVPEHAQDLCWYTDGYWFEDSYGDFEYSDIDEMWATFKSLTEDAHAAAEH